MSQCSRDFLTKSNTMIKSEALELFFTLFSSIGPLRWVLIFSSESTQCSIKASIEQFCKNSSRGTTPKSRELMQSEESRVKKTGRRVRRRDFHKVTREPKFLSYLAHFDFQQMSKITKEYFSRQPRKGNRKLSRFTPLRKNVLQMRTSLAPQRKCAIYDFRETPPLFQRHNLYH